MPTVAVMNQIIEELANVFTELRKAHEIYLVPIITEVPARGKFDLQVCDGGEDYSDFEGGVKREHFKIIVGILKVFKVDYGGKYHRYLSDTTESILVIKERVIDTLEGSYLEVFDEALLVRPLRIVSGGKARGGKEKGLLIKELTFVGGMNETRTS